MGRKADFWLWLTTVFFLALSDAARADDRLRGAAQRVESDAGSFWSSELLIRAQESPYDEPITTDRPDFTEASSSVGRSVIQLESGYTFSYNDNDIDSTLTRTHSGPEFVLRYGITDRVEARLIWNYLWEKNRENGIDRVTDGAEDFIVGSKIELTDPAGWIPESAVILHLVTPTGGSAFSNRHVESEVNLCYSWDLTEEISFACSTGYGSATEFTTTADRYIEYHQSASISTGLTDRLGFYIEYFGLYFDGRDDDTPENYADGGFTFLFDDNNQFDIRAGKGLNDAADDFFGGVGMSFRR